MRPDRILVAVFSIPFALVLSVVALPFFLIGGVLDGLGRTVDRH